MSQNVLQKMVSVQVTDMMMFDDAFYNMKQKYAADMQKIDEQMAKLNTDMVRLYGQTSTIQIGSAKTRPDSTGSNVDSIMDSPLVEGEGDNKALKLKFDLSQFNPNEISVKIINDILIVSAHHEEKTDTSTILREYNRQFLLPKETKHEEVTSALSKDGVLTVHAPLPSTLNLPSTKPTPKLASK